MRTPLARLDLLHGKVRTAAALSGVAFAVLLILMQWGFFGAVEDTATILYKQLDFDLMIRSQNYKHFAQPSFFPRTYLQQAQSLPSVQHVVPIYAGFNLWRRPPDVSSSNSASALTGRRRGIFVLGCRPFDRVFRGPPELTQQLSKLSGKGNVLFDVSSRSEFGSQQVGTTTELGSMRVEIVGQFRLGTGFASDGQIVVGENTFTHAFGNRYLTHISLGLVRLHQPTPELAQQTKTQLQAILPPGVEVFTREEVLAAEKYFWVNRTSVGKIFGLGVLLAFFVGMAIVYQVLSSDVANRLPEYATLKAMGYGAGFLSQVVLKQALMLSVFGFFPGWLLSIGLYELTRIHAGIPMNLTLSRSLIVFVLSMVMCCLSGLASLRKLRTADPADLF